jgi:hypothetical protein
MVAPRQCLSVLKIVIYECLRRSYVMFEMIGAGLQENRIVAEFPY